MRRFLMYGWLSFWMYPTLAQEIGVDSTAISEYTTRELCDKAVDPYERPINDGHSLSAFEEVIFGPVLGYDLRDKTDTWFRAHKQEFQRAFDDRISKVYCEANSSYNSEPMIFRILGDSRNISIVSALVHTYKIDINQLYGPEERPFTILDWLMHFRDHPGKYAGPQEKYQMWIDKFFNEKTGAKTIAQIQAEQEANK